MAPRDYHTLGIQLGSQVIDVPFRVDGACDIYPDVDGLEDRLIAFIERLDLHELPRETVAAIEAHPSRFAERIGAPTTLPASALVGLARRQVLKKIRYGWYGSLIALANATPSFLAPEHADKIQLIADFEFFTFVIDDRNEMSKDEEEAARSHHTVMDILTGVIPAARVARDPSYAPKYKAAADIRERLVAIMRRMGYAGDDLHEVIGAFADTVQEQFDSNLKEVRVKTSMDAIPSDRVYEIRRRETAGVKPFFALTDLLLGAHDLRSQRRIRADLMELETLLLDSVGCVNDVVSCMREAGEKMGHQRALKLDPDALVADLFPDVRSGLPLNGVFTRARDREMSLREALFSKALDHKDALEGARECFQRLSRFVSSERELEALTNRMRWAGQTVYWYQLTDRYDVT